MSTELNPDDRAGGSGVPAPGIPTATNVDHVGWSVQDLDEAVDFTVNVLGGVEVLRAGPFSDDSSDWMALQFDVDPRASVSIALVRLGPTQVVEFLQWSAVDREVEWPLNSDVSASHLAIHVTDLDMALRYLEGHGCSACGDPIVLEGAPHAGLTILYVRTPIGLLIELVSKPDHALPYESTTTARLLAAADAWSS
jgi:glyoxylase I family protein